MATSRGNLSWEDLDQKMARMDEFLNKTAHLLSDSKAQGTPSHIEHGGARPKFDIKESAQNVKSDNDTSDKQGNTKSVKSENVKPVKSDKSTSHNDSNTQNRTFICDPSFIRPRFPTFSGEEKSETSFEVWKNDVNCAIREGTCTESLILQAIRSSLKGKARSLLLTLHGDASPDQIVQKLEGVFGNIHPSEQLFQTFYAAKQEADETVANYGMRLESLLQTCIDRGEVSHGARNEMLRSKLWSGLSDTNLRNASRYKYDTIHDFETLRMELRTIELDLRTSASASPPVSATSSKDAGNKKSHISQVSDNSSSMDAILRKLDAMNKRMTEIERNIEGSKGQSSTGQGAQGDSYNSGRGSGTHSRGTYRGGSRGDFRGGSNRQFRGGSRGFRGGTRGGVRGNDGFSRGFRGGSRGGFRGHARGGYGGFQEYNQPQDDYLNYQ